MQNDIIAEMAGKLAFVRSGRNAKDITDAKQSLNQLTPEGAPSVGKIARVKTVNADGSFVMEWVSGGGSGTDDYEELTNKPQINDVELTGNKTLANIGATEEAPEDGNRYARKNGAWVQLETVTPLAWGNITGTLSEQTDLNLVLEDKASKTYVGNAVTDATNEIKELIPQQATAQNQLADKDFVNSTVGTNTANYISNNGQPFTSLAQLQSYTGTVTNNDYAFVTGTDTSGNIYFDRYKATVSNSTISWAKEYRLNNSSFTAVQWAAINSGITSGDVALIATKENTSNKVTSISGSSTDTQYPSAKAVNTAITNAIGNAIGGAY